MSVCISLIHYSWMKNGQLRICMEVIDLIKLNSNIDIFLKHFSNSPAKSEIIMKECRYKSRYCRTKDSMKNSVPYKRFFIFIRISLQIFDSEFFNFALKNFDSFIGSIVFVSFDHTDAFNDLHSTMNPSKNRVFSIQPLRRSQCNEELWSVRVWTGVGHRKNAGASVFEIGMNFIRECMTIDWCTTTTSASCKFSN